jgi:hypothetical protein
MLSFLKSFGRKMAKKWPKLTEKMAQNGPKWPKMAQNLAISIQIEAGNKADNFVFQENCSAFPAKKFGKTRRK